MELDEKKILKTWTKKQLSDGNCIDDLLGIEGFPLWWFYHRLFEIKIVPPWCITTTKGWVFRKYLRVSEQIKSALNKKNVQRHEGKTKNILFLSYTNHITMKNGHPSYFRLESLLKEIEKEPAMDADVVVINPFSQWGFQHQQYGLSPHSFMTKEIKKNAKTLSHTLARKWRSLKSKTKEELFQGEEGTLWPIVRQQINILYSQEMIYTTALYYFAFKEMIRQRKINAVYTSAISSLYEKCLLAAASSLKIPSFMGQHGVAIGFSNNDTSNLHSMHFLVMGEKYKDNLIKTGIKTDNIFVTGPLIFDELLPYVGREKKQDTILFMTSPLIEDNFISKRDYFEKVKTIFQQLKGFSLPIRIKLHPRERYKEEYEKACREVGLRNAAVLTEGTREEHYHLIDECKVFLNFGSTAALEAMILGKPVIIFGIFGKGKNPINHFIRESEATLKVDYDGDIRNIVKMVLAAPEILKEEREKFVGEHCYKLDGKAQERVVEAIKSKLD